jgi:hypothetical protein
MRVNLTVLVREWECKWPTPFAYENCNAGVAKSTRTCTDVVAAVWTYRGGDRRPVEIHLPHTRCAFSLWRKFKYATTSVCGCPP